jgi:hypothetical protein
MLCIPHCNKKNYHFLKLNLLVSLSGVDYKFKTLLECFQAIYKIPRKPKVSFVRVLQHLLLAEAGSTVGRQWV